MGHTVNTQIPYVLVSDVKKWVASPILDFTALGTVKFRTICERVLHLKVS